MGEGDLGGVSTGCRLQGDWWRLHDGGWRLHCDWLRLHDGGRRLQGGDQIVISRDYMTVGGAYRVETTL